MSVDNLVGLLIAVVLIGFLAATLVFPERF